MDATFSVSLNGYPQIAVNPPCELVGEFLRIFHWRSSAESLLERLEKVAHGILESDVIPVDYAEMHLTGTTQIARIRMEDLVRDEEDEIEVPISLLIPVVEQWVTFLRRHEANA